MRNQEIIRATALQPRELLIAEKILDQFLTIISFAMKKILNNTASIVVVIVLFSFNRKSVTDSEIFKNIPASYYSSEVLDKWMEMQIKLMSRTPSTFNGPFVRIYSYSAIAAYFAVYPGMIKSSFTKFSPSQLNRLQVLPEIDAKKKYHWPASLNAALAFMSRSMFPSASAENKIAIDSLENALNKNFDKAADAVTIERSKQYGLQVARSIYMWAESDGYIHANDAFTPPSGPGNWEPTPPNFLKPSTPHWGSLRTMIEGSMENSEPPAPIPYSEDSASAFYKEVKLVYDISKNMSADQKNIALFWKEINPGITAPGHWLNILRQVMKKENASLDKAAFVYALTGMALNDAWISSWKTRYTYNVLRPVTFIRRVMKHEDWLSFVPTPPHPEYTSGFAAMGGAVCEALAYVFGNDYQLTDHTYDFAGMAPRTYYSFRSMAKEAGDSKLLGGIHYRFSVDAGLQQGSDVAKNIVRILFQQELPSLPAN